MTDTTERSPIVSTGALIEWLVPFAFLVCAGWAVWHTPAYILSFIPPASDSLVEQMSQLHYRKDVTPDMPGLFGGYADILDWLALILLPIIFVIGTRTIRVAPMEFQNWRPIDRTALFVGRITMILIISMTLVMLYEVFLRYAIEAPTLWANELTLWFAGYVFLFSGLYAMQQRCHIRIFLLYDVVPRWAQRCFDVMGAALIVVFAGFLIFGSYKQVFITKFYKWEMFGTAFDPPIPATVQPMILIIVALIAVQAVINVISDWNLEPEVHTAADDIDQEELEILKKSVGSD
ncbi:TRAP transporter small permease subunit [Shimia sp. Alg240-R146]|uniref:TRAP transporter small permease subunit n=1 Tax=Shimia sp. Alg240-R146 TaxID=2993449 RepID=UPI0022E19437|nr:TRAP transporter small permease [Shimia sp. Alg240-R146]